MTSSSTLGTSSNLPSLHPASKSTTRVSPGAAHRSGWRRIVAAAFTERSFDVPPDRVMHDRIMHRIGLALGIAGLIAAVVELPEIAEQGRVIPLRWTVFEVLLAFGFFPVLAIVSVTLSTRAIQRTAGIAAVSFLAAMALTPLAYNHPDVEGSSVWLYRVLALGVLAAAIAWRSRLAVGYLFVGSVLSAMANMVVIEDVTFLASVGDFARALGLSALFLWCAIYTRAAADRVDRESAMESSRAALVAGAAARDRERARFAALIHDAVLSTLLDAARAGTESPVLREQADRTLDQLDRCRVETEPDRLDAQSAIGFLRSAVHEVNPGIRFTAHRWSGLDDLHLPVDTAGTIAAALAEAARNSLRHATVVGREVHRRVTVTISAGGIRVVFRDDGAGFDMDRVPADRLGVSVSILGRMRQLAGGAGFVESQPGEGTTVTLVWGGDG
ncbi:ATP-binding protein [Nocardia callitridis]|uniref:Histidine kinase/HSP90-like ATPase domain-containing protein n=1 Tax=Nocardia callitridis TaxID=648753 RepID=A0ABP9KFA2_9NOCA